ncbi:glycosyltransferase family 4 protein [Spirosoma fluminis]
MMIKPKLSVYTNIPTPYQDDFFTALSAHFRLTVVYYAYTEQDRRWQCVTSSKPYTSVWLAEGRLTRWLQRWQKDYHSSVSILQTAFRDEADYLIVSGAYWVPNTIIAMLAARCRGKKVAFFGECLSRTTPGWKAGLKRMLLIPLRLLCTRIFAIGHDAASSYRQFGITAPITVVPYTVNTERFSGNRQFADTFTLLSSGSLIQRKGMDTVIRAVKALQGEAYAHLRLQIVGEGPERIALQRLIDKDDRIALTGFSDGDALADCFRKADAFVLASRYDGWGVVINEAIAAGLPVISSETVGAAREWVQHGVNGFICPPNDVQAFSDAIRRVVDEPQLRQQQAEFNQHFSQQTSSAHYARIVYQTVLTDLQS